MTITVTGCRVLIKPFKIQEHDKVYASAKAAGIVLADMSERREQNNVDKGTVVQFGNKCHEDYIGEVKIGDVVGYAKFGGKFVQDSNEDLYLILNDEDIICVYKED